MGATLAYLNEALKKDYLPGMVAQINEESSYFYKLMEKNTEPSLGADSTFLVTYGRSGGLGSRAEDGALPTASAASKKQISASPKNFFGTIRLTDRAIKAGKTGAALVNILSTEMEQQMRDSKDNLNRQMFGDGTGTLTTVKTTAATTKTFVVNNAKFLAPGQRIDVLDVSNSNAKLADGAIISNVNKVTNTVTITYASNISVTEGDILVTSGAYGLEISGLDLIMTSGNTLYGVDRSTNSWFDPGVITCSSEILLDDDIMEKAIQMVDLESGMQPDLILAGYTAQRILKNYLSQYQRYTTIDTRYDAGHSTMSYDGIPVERDKYQGENTMDFLKMDTFSLLSLGELFSWMDDDGSVLKAVSGYPMYEAILASYAEIACKHPGANVRVKGIVA